MLAQQTTGALRGVVTDPSGGGVPNAKIDLRNSATGKVFTQGTGPDG